MISAEGFVMFVFRRCASKGCIFCDVDKMLNHSVTVARREQNACRDVNRMMDFALALLPELLWLSCLTPSSEHKNPGQYTALPFNARENGESGCD